MPTKPSASKPSISFPKTRIGLTSGTTALGRNLARVSPIVPPIPPPIPPSPKGQRRSASNAAVASANDPRPENTAVQNRSTSQASATAATSALVDAIRRRGSGSEQPPPGRSYVISHTPAASRTASETGPPGYQDCRGARRPGHHYEGQTPRLARYDRRPS